MPSKWKVTYSYGNFDYRGKLIYHKRYFKTRYEARRFLERITGKVFLAKVFIRGKKSKWKPAEGFK